MNVGQTLKITHHNRTYKAEIQTGGLRLTTKPFLPVIPYEDIHAVQKLLQRVLDVYLSSDQPWPPGDGFERTT